MDRADAHRLVDALFDAADEQPVEGQVIEDTPKRELPKDKRAVRTKSSGDRVYLLDEVKKTRQWVTSPEVLSGLGFEGSDVVEVDDSDLMKYQMATAIYKAPDNA